MSLRPYQQAALDAVADRQVPRGIVALPTGAGKGFIAGNLVAALGVTTALYLAHREELIDQLAAHIQRVTGVTPGIERAERRSAPMDRIVVASVPTLAASGARRLKQWHPSRFSAVITDECHHSTARSYRAVYRHFGILDDADAKVPDCIPHIGLTATPTRGDNVGLDNIFDDILYQYKIGDAIDDGWLVPIRAWTVRTGISLDAVATRRGDFAERELAAAVNTDDRNEQIVDAWMEYAPGKRTVGFAVNVAHAAALASAFAERGISASYVHGGMTTEERRRTIDGFRSGAISVLCNCGVLTEGTDIPEIECVLMARPTKSSTLYAQCLGRGTRLARGAYDLEASIALGKSECLLLDVTDSTERAGRRAVRVGDLFGLPLPTEDIDGQDVREVMAAQEAAVAQAQFATKTGSFDLFAEDIQPPDYAKLAWVALNDTLYLSLAAGRFRCVEDLIGKWSLEAQPNDADTWSRFGETSPSLEHLLARVEPWIRKRYSRQAPLVSRDAKWRSSPPTPKQLAYADRLGISVPENATGGQVSSLISAAKTTQQGAA